MTKIMCTESCCTAKAPKDWVVNIKNLLKEEEAESTAVCILKVPKVLREMKPEDYTPQLIGLGPYHHWRPDIYEMELYKLVVAKNTVAEFSEKPLETLVSLVSGINDEHKAQIRACYDRYLDLDNDELSWLMVIDAIFLLQFLQVFVHDKDSKSCLGRHKRICYLGDKSQSAYHAILKDMMMLENQIPFLVLEHIHDEYHTMRSQVHNLSAVHDATLIQHKDGENKAIILVQLLSAACKKLSPILSGLRELSSQKPSHLLELLYYTIVPDEMLNYQSRQEQGRCQSVKYEKKRAADKEDQGSKPRTSCLPKFIVAEVGKITLNWVPGCRLLKCITAFTSGLIQALQLSIQQVEHSSSDGQYAEAPQIEEIDIPSVAQLLSVGVNFCVGNGPIDQSISFDKRTKTFCLPPIRIDGNMEVIMRNLVAYEAAAISGPLVLARYTELMNGIIDEAEDVEALRKSKIISAQYMSDKDVASLWNQMSRSIRLSHVPSIDKVVTEVNDYYHTRTRVRFIKFTNTCVIHSAKILLLFLAFFLLLLLFVQSFCQFYNCRPLIDNAAKGYNLTS